MTCFTCSSSSSPIEITQGDLLPAYFADVTGVDGRFDFTGWTLTFQLLGPVVLTGPAVGSDAGELRHDWAIGETDVPGDYEVLFHGLAPDGRPQTFRVPETLRILPP